MKQIDVIFEQHSKPVVINSDHHFDIQITKRKDAEGTALRASNSFDGENAVGRTNKTIDKLTEYKL